MVPVVGSLALVALADSCMHKQCEHMLHVNNICYNTITATFVPGSQPNIWIGVDGADCGVAGIDDIDRIAPVYVIHAYAVCKQYIIYYNN